MSHIGIPFLMYEDQLPVDMPQYDYDEWRAASSVVQGVRVGPIYPDPNTQDLRSVLREARALIAYRDFSVRDAVYESAPNGAADSAAISLLYAEGNLRRDVMAKQDVLEVFDRLIGG